jgi:hypothetical protein
MLKLFIPIFYNWRLPGRMEKTRTTRKITEWTQVKVDGPGGGGSKEDEDYWLDSESR